MRRHLNFRGLCTVYIYPIQDELEPENDKHCYKRGVGQKTPSKTTRLSISLFALSPTSCAISQKALTKAEQLQVK